ncbi:MAG TPA: patatin-like phospholipase family protein [Bryobacteraceae bacterium]|nr:patatin-like phospholipase family protein [Bryobacteraceae bacterium]
MATLFSNTAGTRIGLALGGGFARGIAHVGVLRVFARAGIPIHSIGGVSSGAITAAAFASGCSTKDIEVAAKAMRAASVENLMSFAMGDFLRSLLKHTRFEQMTTPLAIVASDLTAGAPVIFKDRGDVLLPLHASCAYPGLFPPVRYMDHWLVDGMVTMDVPAAPLRRMGATHVISVTLRGSNEPFDPRNKHSVVERSFEILTARNESHWRRSSDVVISPESGAADGAQQAIEAGERAAEEALPHILEWLPQFAAA